MSATLSAPLRQAATEAVARIGEIAFGRGFLLPGDQLAHALLVPFDHVAHVCCVPLSGRMIEIVDITEPQDPGHE